jgi:hypothetical protein
MCRRRSRVVDWTESKETGDMSKDLLNIGWKIVDGCVTQHVMTLPSDLGDKKIAMVAQSNKGKTYGLGVILEELAKIGRPFLATDPATNLWGLRVKPDGTPSGLPVVVIGGLHGDIPLEKDAGERVAEALLAAPQCVVIDLTGESAGNTRRFMTDLATRLMKAPCDFSLPIFLEEAPVLIPQSAYGPQMQICKAAVSKLATLGGNFGYGVFPATQRAATLDKDVLSQCEALIVMGLTHKKDRDTVADWIEAKDIGGRVDVMFAELGSLKPGEAWLWWPGEDRFEKFTFRRRETLHPREMKKLGLKHGAVQLGDAKAFVEKLKKELTKTTAAAPQESKLVKSAKSILAMAKHPELKEVLVEANAGVRKALGESSAREKELRDEIAKLAMERGRLSTELAEARRGRADAERRLDAVRKHLRPEYDALAVLFGELGESTPAGGAAQDLARWQPWLEKAAAVGCRRVLEILIERGSLKQVQLATLAGIKFGGSTWRNYRSWMTRNSLATLKDDDIIVAVLA